MRLTLVFVAFLLLGSGWHGAGSNAPVPAEGGPVILELFTSQGCSSCPPADRLLQRMAAEAARQGQPVYALSFHVDYWDRLGWRDPFSHSDYSDRQRAYARVMRNPRIYTPQLVVNGQWELIGSNEREARETIRKAQRAASAHKVALSAAASQHFKYTVTGPEKGHVLHLALVQQLATTEIKRGENGGRTLRNEHVVRELITQPLSQAAQGQVTFTQWDQVAANNREVVAWVQRTSDLHITGAVRLTL